MKLSVSVMAHPAREEWVGELLEALGREVPVPVSWDTAGPPSSNLEKQWANASRAWGMHDPDADWHMMVQDDAIVVPDLLAGLEKALDHVPPNVVVQPYIGTKQPYAGLVSRKVAAADEMDASWISMPSLMWGVAVIVPVSEISGMLAWCSHPERRTWADDKRVGRYFRDVLGWGCYCPWPSLVDHRQGPSISGHDNGGRRARRMWDRSALERDWTGPVVTDVRPYRIERNRSVPIKVRMTHPRGRGDRIVPEHDVPRWESRGWQVDEPDEPVAAETSEPASEPPKATRMEVSDSGGLANVVHEAIRSGEVKLRADDLHLETVSADEDAQDDGEANEVPEVLDNAAVRAWAAANDIEVSPRGKIPQRVIEAFLAAHEEAHA